MRLLVVVFAVGFFDRVTEYVTDNPWTYAVVFSISAVDAFFPLVPSETVVIAAGTIAAGGDLVIYAIVPAAALGAFAGDNVSYFLGDRIGEPAAERLLSGEHGRRRLRWAKRTLDRQGAPIIVAARFVPGGRTATTFASGMLDLTWRRFAVYDAIGATVWAFYAGMIGFLGGSAFRDELWKALALAFGLALLLAVAIEGWRRFQHRRGKDIFGGSERRNA